MILCPVQNTAVLKQNWVQVRPRISQKFGITPFSDVYKQFGMIGHNGRDYAIPVGTPIFAPMDGEIIVKDSGKEGYGLHIRIRNDQKDLECVLGHLSETLVYGGRKINMGDKIALSGNTGFSFGPHLHCGFRRLRPSDKDVWSWEVLDYDNGYFGYFDHEEFEITWKGTFLKNTL